MTEDWRYNYYNYFTEVEEHFQRARGTALFQVSPLDWALMETWKNAGIPLEAVLRGIDLAFEKWRSKKIRRREVNSLAYCTQAVIDEAERMERGQAAPAARAEASAPFTLDDLHGHLQAGVDGLSASGIAEFDSVVAALREILATLGEHYHDLEGLEEKLSALEDKMIAIRRARQTDADLAAARTELNHYLKPYRSSMTAPQLTMLEKQFLDRWLFERAALPRLSLFYIRPL